MCEEAFQLIVNENWHVFHAEESNDMLGTKALFPLF